MIWNGFMYVVVAQVPTNKHEKERPHKFLDSRANVVVNGTEHRVRSLTVFSRTRDPRVGIPENHWALIPTDGCGGTGSSMITKQEQEKKRRYLNRRLGSHYMATTAEPEQETPNHELPHGSPPLRVHPESCRGLFKEAYSTPRAWTANQFLDHLNGESILPTTSTTTQTKESVPSNESVADSTVTATRVVERRRRGARSKRAASDARERSIPTKKREASLISSHNLLLLLISLSWQRRRLICLPSNTKVVSAKPFSLNKKDFLLHLRSKEEEGGKEDDKSGIFFCI